MIETVLDVLFFALEVALREGEISQEQYAEAYAFLMVEKG